MSEYAKISKNSGYAFLSTFFRLFANIILFWIIARFYGKEIFGQFTTAQTFAAMCVLVADFGLDVLLTTEIPRNINNTAVLFRRYFSIKLVLTSIASIGMLLIAVISDFNVQTKYLIIIFSFYASFTTLTNFLYALYKGNEKLQYEAKVSFIINFGALIIILFLIFLQQSIIVLAITFSATRLLGMFIAIYYAYHLVPDLKFKVEFKETKNVLSQVMIFGMFLIFGNLFFQLDTILLAFLKGEESVGIYQAVFRLIVLPLLIPEVIINSLLPTLSRLNSADNAKWQRLSEIFNKFLLIISFPISIVIYLFADIIIGIVYGTAEYSIAIPILRIFAFIVFIRFCFEGNGLILTTSKRQKTRMQIVFIATLFNLILNYFLIPKYGIFGAAYVSLFTNVFVAIAYFIATKKSVGSPIHKMLSLQFVSIILFLLLSSLLLDYLKVGYLGLISILIYFYFVIMFVMTKQEKNYFKELSILKINRNSKQT